jgi:tRNA(Arg) A34 adenosine deaminase TadA
MSKDEQFMRRAIEVALRAVPGDVWDSACEISLYTTLEPCLVLCFHTHPRNRQDRLWGIR